MKHILAADNENKPPQGSFPNVFSAKDKALANTRLAYLISGDLSAHQNLSALQRHIRENYPDWVNPDKPGVAVFRGGGGGGGGGGGVVQRPPRPPQPPHVPAPIAAKAVVNTVVKKKVSSPQ